MSPDSVKYYTEAFLSMMKGKCYKERINVDATRYFLEMINVDFGQQTLGATLSSVEQHIEYREKLENSNLRTIRGIHRDFLKEKS